MCMLRHLPEVFVRAFIDDSYLWVRLQHVAMLDKALQVTHLWDSLAGQKLNEAKSTVWATTTDARSVAKSTFPAMKLEYELNVLGSMLYTSQRACYAFPEEKVVKIVADTKNISALPLSRPDKSKLLGMKVLPQCTFTAGLWNIPKQALNKIQAEIVNTLWHNRPPWRSKWLVLTFLGKPHRVEPVTARAYSAIMDFLRYVQINPNCKTLCQQLLAADHMLKSGYMTKLKEACSYFDITVHPDFSVSWHNSDRMPIEDITAKDMRRVLQNIALNTCYQQAAHAHRKDFVKPEGILDFQLTTLFYTASKVETNTPFPAYALFENQLVGASTTRDRLAATKLCETAECRFCKKEKESMTHLVDCEALAQKIGSLPAHELGPNFRIFGIVEHPKRVAEYRLRCAPIPKGNGQMFDPLRSPQEIWSDGSIAWGNHHWLTTGAFALIDQHGECLGKGPVLHWALSSYTTELWAILWAIVHSPWKIIIYSDCQTVVKQFHTMQSTGQTNPQWAHQAWWKEIHRLWKQRLLQTDDPIVLHWIPAHLFEHLPVEMIPETLATSKGTTKQHIQQNRIVDRLAKSVAQAETAVDVHDQAMLFNAIVKRQDWLTKLGELLYYDVQAARLAQFQDHDPEREQANKIDKQTCINKFPKLGWHAKKHTFPWKPSFAKNLPEPKKWPMSATEWKACATYCHQMRWQENADASVSFAELALLFWLRGYKFDDMDPATTSFRDVMKKLRRALCIMHKLPAGPFFPGTWENSLNRNCGKSLPAGCIVGAIPWMSDQELQVFSNLLHSGAAQTLASWDWFLDDLLLQF